MRRLLLLLTFTLLFVCCSTAAYARATADWKVQAGKDFYRAGEWYSARGKSTDLQDAFEAYGPPTTCKLVAGPSAVVATWASRGISVSAATFGLMPEGENGCVSPDIIHISRIRLTDKRWLTSFGLHVGDPTTKLRRLYPKALYFSASRAYSQNRYYLVWRRQPCYIGLCTPYELKYGIEVARLIAEVRRGRVIAFSLPVGAQGD